MKYISHQHVDDASLADFSRQRPDLRVPSAAPPCASATSSRSFVVLLSSIAAGKTIRFVKGVHLIQQHTPPFFKQATNTIRLLCSSANSAHPQAQHGRAGTRNPFRSRQRADNQIWQSTFWTGSYSNAQDEHVAIHARDGYEEHTAETMRQIYQSYLDKSTPFTTYRWIGTGVVLLLFFTRIVVAQGWYIGALQFSPAFPAAFLVP